MFRFLLAIVACAAAGGLMGGAYLVTEHTHEYVAVAMLTTCVLVLGGSLATLRLVSAAPAALMAVLIAGLTGCTAVGCLLSLFL